GRPSRHGPVHRRDGARRRLTLDPRAAASAIHAARPSCKTPSRSSLESQRSRRGMAVGPVAPGASGICSARPVARPVPRLPRGQRKACGLYSRDVRQIAWISNPLRRRAPVRLIAGPMSRLDILTFGCRLNAFESEVIRAEAAAAGLDDAVIVNTCAVTAEAERQARQAIRRARRARPDARLIVTGCAAQIRPQHYAAMPEIDQVLGNEAKLRRGSYGADTSRVLVGDIGRAPMPAPPPLDALERRARAVVQVQQGCDHRCTFCTIPLGRG